MRIVLVGCGHAQLPLLCAAHHLVNSGYTVTAVNSSTHLYYPGMSPGYLGDSYQEDNLKINVAKLAEEHGVTFLSARVQSIDMKARTISTDTATIPYDIASINLGSVSTLSLFAHLDRDALYTSIFPAKPTKEFLVVKERIKACFREAHQTAQPQVISIVGGGPAAVEIASNIAVQYDRFRASDAATTTAKRSSVADAERLVTVRLFSNGPILAGHSLALRRRTERALYKRGVEIKRTHITHLDAHALQATTGDGEARYASRLTIVAAGITPPTLLRAAGCSVDSDGAMRVNRYLQSIDDEAVFAAGDCVHFTPRPLPRVGVYAVRQGVTIRQNVLAHAAALSAGKRRQTTHLTPFRPQHNFFFSLNMGAGHGIATKYRITWEGRRAFRLKDRFDQQFIDRYHGTPAVVPVNDTLRPRGATRAAQRGSPKG